MYPENKMFIEVTQTKLHNSTLVNFANQIENDERYMIKGG